MNILYLGFSGFPYGQAEYQRLLLISKGLADEGSSITVIGSQALYTPKSHPGIRKFGHFENVKYVNANFTRYRSPSFFKRNSEKPFAKILEFCVILKLRRRHKIDAAIISTMNFRHLLIYKIFSLFLGFKILLNLVEYNSGIKNENNINQKLNDFFFDRYAIKISDGILPISEFLIKRIIIDNSKKPFLKIPIVADSKRFSTVEKRDGKKYFLYCGTAVYQEVIFFIIKAFELIDDNSFFLQFVIHGNAEKLALIKNRIKASPKAALIKQVSGISDSELSYLYKNAIGLLIPLRPSEQDEARFPHKFGEYLFSENPVVTTNFGEIKYYLKDGENALISATYDEKAFADKMNFIIKEPAKSTIIGKNGKTSALEFADYKLYGDKIIKFIRQLQA